MSEFQNKELYWMRTAAEEVLFLADHAVSYDAVPDFVASCVERGTRYAAATGKVPVATYHSIGVCLAAAELISVAPRSELAEAIHQDLDHQGDGVRVALVKFAQARWPECYRWLEQFEFERCFKAAP